MQNSVYVMVTIFILALFLQDCSPSQLAFVGSGADQPATRPESESTKQTFTETFVFNGTVTPLSENAITATITPPHVAVSTTAPLPGNSRASTPVAKLNSKKGIILPDAYSFCQDLENLKVSWYYRNNIRPADCPADDIRFVPRLSNAKVVTDEALAEAIENARAAGWMIGYTEPNLPWWDGKVTPREGALIWRKVEEAALPAGIKLVSPSPSQHEPGEYDDYGYTWIWAMVDAYENEFGEKPHFDAMAWNIYARRVNEVHSFLNARRHEALDRGYDVPFWILEYGGRCWDTDNYPTGNTEIMTEITLFLENTPWIARYVWFANRIKPDDPWAPNWHSCTLINPETGELTDLGKLYAAY